MRIVIYPGTFDPITNGHKDIVLRSAKLFDRVIVAVADSRKKTLFDHQKRIAMVRQVAQQSPNVEVVGFSELLVDFVKRYRAQAVIRGLRALSDFEYEFQLANMNRQIGAVESIFLVPSPENTFISSSLVKEVASLGGDITSFVSECVCKELREHFQK